VDKIRSLLAARGLSLADVSRKSRPGPLYSSLHHIPHNLYDAIRRRQFTPSIYQIAALSLLSGYRFVDWLELFGLSLDNVPRFQVIFSAVRTVELDARAYHPTASVPWFRDVAKHSFSAPLMPLSSWLSAAKSPRIDSLDLPERNAFRFVKIGSQDAFAFPDLLPGSIVRVKPLAATRKEITAGTKSVTNLVLVEHGRGLICSQIYRPAPNQIVLCSRQLPYAPAELQLGTQAVLLGAADVEIRRIVNIERPIVPSNLGGYWKALALPPHLPRHNVGEFIRRARERSGLSFRETSERTRQIANELRDSRYFCAPGSLSDFETRKSPPRHVQKLISICAANFASAADFLEAAGVQLNGPSQLPMPLHFLKRQEPDKRVEPARASFECMREIKRRFRQLPYSLHKAMPTYFGVADLSVRDIFWAGGIQRVVHPYLRGAEFLVVDRRKKIPRISLSCPKWAQPLYVLLLRDGSYLCGSCTLVGGVLIVRQCRAGLPKQLQLRNQTDAEIVGQVVGIVRRLK
jgi:transcriptional regulator with XRE-family HTH domain